MVIHGMVLQFVVNHVVLNLKKQAMDFTNLLNMKKINLIGNVQFAEIYKIIIYERNSVNKRKSRDRR